MKTKKHFLTWSFDFKLQNNWRKIYSTEKWVNLTTEKHGAIEPPFCWLASELQLVSEIFGGNFLFNKKWIIISFILFRNWVGFNKKCHHHWTCYYYQYTIGSFFYLKSPIFLLLKWAPLNVITDNVISQRKLSLLGSCNKYTVRWGVGLLHGKRNLVNVIIILLWSDEVITLSGV
jgi:hypothetical protein